MGEVGGGRGWKRSVCMGRILPQGARALAHKPCLAIEIAATGAQGRPLATGFAIKQPAKASFVILLQRAKRKPPELTLEQPGTIVLSPLTAAGSSGIISLAAGWPAARAGLGVEKIRIT